VNDGATSMARHGSSFALASQLLPAPTAARVGRLYAACRAIDDLADNEPALGAPRLQSIRARLEGGSLPDPLADALMVLAAEGGFDVAHARALVKGVQTDLEPVRVETAGELLVYAYRVAGTVGAMMAPLLGAVGPDAEGPAVELGIAMQLTNVARDVLEDGRANRRYLPAEWVDLPPQAIAAATPAARDAVPPALEALLGLADRFYGRGLAGLPHLPLRARATVAVAAAVYRGIGTVIRERRYAYWQGRAVVAKPRRWLIATRALAEATAAPPPPMSEDKACPVIRRSTATSPCSEGVAPD